MKNKQIEISKSLKEANHDLLDQLLDVCYIDALTGRFHCKKCKNIVHIDWSRHIAFCSIHGMLV